MSKGGQECDSIGSAIEGQIGLAGLMIDSENLRGVATTRPRIAIVLSNLRLAYGPIDHLRYYMPATAVTSAEVDLWIQSSFRDTSLFEAIRSRAAELPNGTQPLVFEISLARATNATLTIKIRQVSGASDEFAEGTFEAALSRSGKKSSGGVAIWALEERWH
jgi:hypothetical protein